MSALVIENGRVVLPDAVRDGWSVACDEGRILAVGRRVRRPRGATLVDARGAFITPGFVDLHVHGGGGADFMDGTVDAVRTALATHARHGTTTLFPTTTTGSPARIRRMLDACRSTRNAWEPRYGARIGGVHVYGPYFAEEKVGCHAPSGRRDPDPREYRPWFADDLVRIATCAAELPGAVAFCRLAGSVVGMDHMVRRMIRDTSAELPDVIRMASLTPAERVGIAADVGSLERGKSADVVLLSPRLAVRGVFVAGVEIDHGS